jgi:hypothetical protein
VDWLEGAGRGDGVERGLDEKLRGDHGDNEYGGERNGLGRCPNSLIVTIAR